MPVSDKALTSPGRAMSERWDVEVELSSELARELRSFLVDVEALVADATRGPVLVAGAGDPFTLSSVASRWERFVNRTTRTLAVWLEKPITDPFLAASAKRVAQAPLPGRVYTKTRDTLVLAGEQGWSRERTMNALAEAMDAERGSWRSSTDRIARTEATAVFNHSSLNRLADLGYSEKRWVAHHDKATRGTHAAADGQRVPLVAEFSVGGYGLIVPGDPSAPLAETANCRCVIVGAG